MVAGAAEQGPHMSSELHAWCLQIPTNVRNVRKGFGEERWLQDAMCRLEVHMPVLSIELFHVSRTTCICLFKHLVGLGRWLSI